jgi:hypothetical protein
MNTTTHEPLNLNDEERAFLEELLESASTKLMVEIRRTDHRVYRDELRHRLTLVEALRERCRHPTWPIRARISRAGARLSMITSEISAPEVIRALERQRRVSARQVHTCALGMKKSNAR